MCGSVVQRGRCADVLKQYGLDICTVRKCWEGVRDVCIPTSGDCGGCGGPCNNASDVSNVFLQPAAFGGPCGTLANTVGHEMAHACGVGPDVDSRDRSHMANRKKATEVGLACGDRR